MRQARTLTFSALGVAPLVAFIFACGSSSSGGSFATGDGGSSGGSSGSGSGGNGSSGASGSGGGGTLLVKPSLVTLAAVVNGGSSQQAVTVLEHFSNGSFDNDVTSKATITLGDPMIAMVMGANIEGGKYGGNTTITATVPGDTPGMAMLKVQLSGDIPNGVGGLKVGQFSSAPVNAGMKPTISAPTSGTTLTSASPPLQVSWAAVSGCTYYRVHIQSTDLLNVFEYTAGATSLTLDAMAWPSILKSMVGAQATVTTEGWDGAVPGNRYVSDPVTLMVTQ